MHIDDPFDAGDDYSGHFSTIRTKLADDRGTRYVEFVRTLRPRYGVVYRDIALGYGFLVLVYALTTAAPYWRAPAGIVAVLGAVGIGYWIAYLQLFIHEGAHYNLASSKTASDRICNLLIAWMVGTSVALYRPVHFQHHRALGSKEDSEFTYFYPLSLVFLLKAAFGVRALEVILYRAGMPKTQSRKSGSSVSVPLVVGALVHLGIIVGSLLAGAWWSALAWAAGVGLAFPFFAALRQLLEHRGEHARADIDYRAQDHGAFTRLFGDGLFASTFGGAGFNRHLLHHWEPQASYTNLSELERFLQKTQVAAVMDRRRAGYAETFRRLISLN